VSRDVRRKVLLAKTGLDGHWRGVMVVANALRNAGFEIVFIGAATSDQILSAAIQEDVDLVGLNIGGRVEVALRIIEALRELDQDLPVFVGGTLPPDGVASLALAGIRSFPPGSRLEQIVEAALALTES
jgi:methylmalonyl-CoA mutase, C-terminal domain